MAAKMTVRTSSGTPGKLRIVGGFVRVVFSGTETSGTGQLGYLHNATVRFLDVVTGAYLTTKPAVVRTDSDGNYTALLPASAPDLVLVEIEGGVDTTTGETNDMPLSTTVDVAAAGTGNVVSPLTTVATELLKDEIAEIDPAAGAPDAAALSLLVGKTKAKTAAAYGIEVADLAVDLYEQDRTDLAKITTEVQVVVKALKSASTDSADPAAAKNAFRAIAKSATKDITVATDAVTGAVSVTSAPVPAVDPRKSDFMADVVNQFKAKEIQRMVDLGMAADAAVNDGALVVAQANIKNVVEVVREKANLTEVLKAKKVAVTTVVESRSIVKREVLRQTAAAETIGSHRKSTSQAPAVAFKPGYGFSTTEAIEVPGGPGEKQSWNGNVEPAVALVSSVDGSAIDTAATADGEWQYRRVPPTSDWATLSGRHLVMYQARNVATGEVTSLAQMYDVVDPALPTIRWTGSGRAAMGAPEDTDEVELLAGSAYVFGNAVTVELSGEPHTFEASGTVDTNVIGTYTHTFSAKVGDTIYDGQNGFPDISLTRTVRVKPTLPTLVKSEADADPVDADGSGNGGVIVLAPIQVRVDKSVYTDYRPTVRGWVTASEFGDLPLVVSGEAAVNRALASNESGATFTLTYEASDVAHQFVRAVRTVETLPEPEDKTGPTITVADLDPVTFAQVADGVADRSSLPSFSATATDGVDGAVDVRVRPTRDGTVMRAYSLAELPEVLNGNPGKYSLAYTAVDAALNPAENAPTQTVTVLPTLKATHALLTGFAAPENQAAIHDLDDLFAVAGSSGTWKIRSETAPVVVPQARWYRLYVRSLNATSTSVYDVGLRGIGLGFDDGTTTLDHAAAMTAAADAGHTHLVAGDQAKYNHAYVPPNDYGYWAGSLSTITSGFTGYPVMVAGQAYGRATQFVVADPKTVERIVLHGRGPGIPSNPQSCTLAVADLPANASVAAVNSANWTPVGQWALDSISTNPHAVLSMDRDATGTVSVNGVTANVYANTVPAYVAGPIGGLAIANGSELRFETTPDYEAWVAAGSAALTATVRAEMGGVVTADLDVVVSVADANDAPSFGANAAVTAASTIYSGQDTGWSHVVAAATDPDVSEPLYIADGVRTKTATHHAYWNSHPTGNGVYLTSALPNGWAQLDLGTVHRVVGVRTQGRGDTGSNSWVTHYQVETSTDGTSFTYVDQQATFEGNTDRTTVVERRFATAVTARYVRVRPTANNGGSFLRFDVVTQESDAGSLTYSLAEPLVSGIVLTGNVLTYDGATALAGDSVTVTVRASDPHGGTGDAQITVPVSEAPDLSLKATHMLTDGTLYAPENQLVAYDSAPGLSDLLQSGVAGVTWEFLNPNQVDTQLVVATNAMTDDADWTKTNGYVNGTETWIFGATGATCNSQSYYVHESGGLFGSFLLYTGSTITETSNYVTCSAAIKAVDDDSFGMVFLNSDDDQTHYLLYVSTTYKCGTSSYILLFKRVDGTRTFIGRVPTSGDGSFNTSPYTAEFITYKISQTIDADGTVRIQLAADGVPLKLQLESDGSVVESYVDPNPIHTGRNGFFSAGNHGNICKDFRQEHRIEIPAPPYFAGPVNGLAIVNGSELRFVEAPDYEAWVGAGSTRYTATVRATAGNGSFVSGDAVISVGVTDANDAPAFAQATYAAPAKIVSQLDTNWSFVVPAASDPDAGDSIVSYALVPSPASGITLTDRTLTYDGQTAIAGASLALTVRATSSGGLQAETQVTVAVLQEPDLSLNSTGATVTALENQAHVYDLDNFLSDASMTPTWTIRSATAPVVVPQARWYRLYADAQDGMGYHFGMALVFDDGTTSVDTHGDFMVSPSAGTGVLSDASYHITTRHPSGGYGWMPSIASTTIAGQAYKFRTTFIVGPETGAADKRLHYAIYRGNADSMFNGRRFALQVWDGLPTATDSDLDAANWQTVGQWDTTDANSPNGTASNSALLMARSHGQATIGDGLTVFTNTAPAYVAGPVGGLAIANGSELRFDPTPDYEAWVAAGSAELTATVRAEMGGVVSEAVDVVVSVADANDAPSFGANAAVTVTETIYSGQDTGWSHVVAAATDPDAGDTVSYSLVEPLVSGIVLTGNVLTYDGAAALAGDSVTVTVRASDPHGATGDAQITVPVAGAPDLSLVTTHALLTGAIQAPENQTAVVADLNVLLQNDPGGVTWEFVGAANGLAIVGASELRFATAPDLESPTGDTYAATVRATAIGGLFASAGAAVSVTVMNVNESPAWGEEGAARYAALALAPQEPWAMAPGVAAVDPDAGDTLSYAVTGVEDAGTSAAVTNGDGGFAFSADAGNGLVSYDGASALAPGTYKVTLTATDQGGLGDALDIYVPVAPALADPGPVRVAGGLSYDLSANLFPAASGEWYDPADPGAATNATWEVVAGSLTVANGDVSATELTTGATIRVLGNGMDQSYDSLEDAISNATDEHFGAWQRDSGQFYLLKPGDAYDWGPGAPNPTVAKVWSLVRGPARMLTVAPPTSTDWRLRTTAPNPDYPTWQALARDLRLYDYSGSELTVTHTYNQTNNGKWYLFYQNSNGTSAAVTEHYFWTDTGGASTTVNWTFPTATSIARFSLLQWGHVGNRMDACVLEYSPDGGTTWVAHLSGTSMSAVKAYDSGPPPDHDATGRHAVTVRARKDLDLGSGSATAYYTQPRTVVVEFMDAPPAATAGASAASGLGIGGLVGAYDGTSASATSGTSWQWSDLSGQANHATAGTGGIPTVETGPNGQSVLSFTTSQGVTFPATLVEDGPYTLFHVARYADTGTHARIIAGTSGNWLSGFVAGWAGATYHEHWMTPTADVHGTSWVVSTDQATVYRSNGVDRVTSPGGESPDDPISINNGNHSQPSDCKVAEVLIYDRELTQAEYETVERYLAHKYQVPMGAALAVPTAPAVSAAVVSRVPQDLAVGSLSADAGAIARVTGVEAAVSVTFDGDPVVFPKENVPVTLSGGTLSAPGSWGPLDIRGALKMTDIASVGTTIGRSGYSFTIAEDAYIAWAVYERYHPLRYGAGRAQRRRHDDVLERTDGVDGARVKFGGKTRVTRRPGLHGHVLSHDDGSHRSFRWESAGELRTHGYDDQCA